MAASFSDNVSFSPKPRALALRAGQVAAIAAEKYADVHLVFLALEPAEETLHAFVIRTVALDDESLFVVGQLRPRDVQPQAVPFRRPLQLGELRAIVRLAPGLDGVLLDRLR